MSREKWRPFLFIIEIILSLTACKKEPTDQRKERYSPSRISICIQEYV